MRDTRGRMIDAAIAELQQRGLAGMSFSDVLARSGAARGVIYHHFPGGKTQMAAEAAEANGREVCGYLAALDATSPRGVVESFIDGVRPAVEASAAGGGCAVAAVAVGSTGESDPLRVVAAATLSSWVDQLAERLASAGMDSDAASDLAQMLIAILQGAHVLCRAAGSIEPFDHAARALTALLQDAR
ncbi:TetR/AcrR family transcriptional regulator [Mycolicibacterium sp. CBMA 226]|uniref:TetR/AcrR family transcriptional regulator n=1 Tax=Mycolicibacterium sp. CBMA 226 TaxID=2606611 RepID=UPI0012DCBD34|nr:TetR/AcrR family transcriptional regulator [Mycolicibacterium sp. CBMA 226]MUL77125.1 TetR/AcrR family transcriptional regulator [Mycolicibacterium sp. CBMA 226]